MDTSSPSQLGVIRFGVFELDLRAGELRKQGVKVKLQDQPFQVLQVLLEKPGDIVSREDLRKRIWPSDTFVDFDGGVNNAIKRLREALGDSADNPRFIETIPRRGYRFMGPVNGNASAIPAIGSSTVPDSTAPRPSNRILRLGIPMVLGFAALLLAVVAFTPSNWKQRLWRKSYVPQIRSIAVLPLQNLSGDPTQEYFADAMTEELITELSRIRALKVISRTSVMRFKRTDKPLPEIARALGVDGIVEGSVLRSGDRVRITAQLIYAAKDTNLWAETYDRDLRDVLALQSTVASAIAKEINVEVTPQEQTHLKNMRPVNHKALDAYLEGRHHLDKADAMSLHNGLEKAVDDELRMAVVSFEQAIREDPGYVPAYLGIVDTMDLWCAKPPELLQKARVAVAKALQLDDSLVQAHLDNAWLLMRWDWNWVGAEKEYLRALELNPNSADAHEWYARYLNDMGGRAEARKERELAQQLDPEHNYFADFDLPDDWNLDRDREYLDATDPNNGVRRAVLGKHFEIDGRYKEAVEQYIKAAELYGYHNWATMLQRDYAKGDYEGAIRHWMAAWGALSKRRYLSPFWPAFLYAGLNDRDQAFAWLERAYQEHDWCIVHLKDDPIWNRIRPDPRFNDLLRRVGLPP
jgi:TolB-like protein/DNA-binding winged helix-turn-helix (wHTH) protein